MRTVHVDIIVKMTIPLKPGENPEFVIDELDYNFFDTGIGGNIEDTHIKEKKTLEQTENKAIVQIIVHAVLKLDDETTDVVKWLNDEMDYTFQNGNDQLQDTEIVDYDITDSR